MGAGKDLWNQFEVLFNKHDWLLHFSDPLRRCDTSTVLATVLRMALTGRRPPGRNLGSPIHRVLQRAPGGKHLLCPCPARRGVPSQHGEVYVFAAERHSELGRELATDDTLSFGCLPRYYERATAQRPHHRLSPLDSATRRLQA